MLSQADAEVLYSSSVVEVEKQLYIVEAVEHTVDGPRLLLRCFRSGAHSYQPADPLRVTSPSTYRLGYVQISGMSRNALYLRRIPARSYGLGWNERNISHFPSLSSLRSGRAMFVQNLEGVFPPFERALLLAREHGADVAYNRQFAVRGGGEHICYRGEAAMNLNADLSATPRATYPQALIKLFEESKQGIKYVGL